MQFEDTFILKTAPEVLEGLVGNNDEYIDDEIKLFERYAYLLGQKRYDDLVLVVSEDYDPIWYFTASAKQVLYDRSISIFELKELNIKLIREEDSTLVFKNEEEALKFLKWGWEKEYASVEESFSCREAVNNTLTGIAQRLGDFLADNHFFPEGLYVDGDMVVVHVDGDWKHDHQYVDYLVDTFAEKENLTFTLVENRVIGDSDSDWYESLHIYKIED